MIWRYFIYCVNIAGRKRMLFNHFLLLSRPVELQIKHYLRCKSISVNEYSKCKYVECALCNSNRLIIELDCIGKSRHFTEVPLISYSIKSDYKYSRSKGSHITNKSECGEKEQELERALAKKKMVMLMKIETDSNSWL